MNILVPTTIVTFLLAVILGVITQNSPAWNKCLKQCEKEPGENKSVCGASHHEDGGRGFRRFRNPCEVKCMNRTVSPMTDCCPPRFYDKNCTMKFGPKSTKAPNTKG